MSNIYNRMARDSFSFFAFFLDGKTIYDLSKNAYVNNIAFSFEQFNSITFHPFLKIS